MDDLELVKKGLADTPLSELPAVSEKTGVPFGTLHKIKYGKTQNPRFDTVKPLADYYKALAA